MMNDVQRAENEQRAINIAVLKISKEISEIYRSIDLQVPPEIRSRHLSSGNGSIDLKITT